MEEAVEVLSLVLQRPLLTADEEIRLGRQIRSGGPNAVTARERLIESNVRLVTSFVRSLNAGRYSEDLIAEGNLGLISAVDKYDPEMGFKFSTYAIWWIRRAIYRSALTHYNDFNVARLPIHFIAQLGKLEKLIERDPKVENDLEQLAIQLGVRVETVLALIRARRNGYIALSLDAPGLSGVNNWEETVSEPTEPNVELEIVEKLLQALEPREAEIMRLIYLEGLQPADVGEVFKLSKHRVNQICFRARLKLRQKFRTLAKVA